MWSTLRELRIQADWWLKGRLRWSAPARIDPVGDLEPWLADLPENQRARAEALRERYDLSSWSTGCDREDVELNLYHLDILDQHLSDVPAPTRALDVGCRAWWNLPANHAFRPAPWLGIELDGHQRYVDGATRAGLARRRTELFEGASYRTGSVTELDGPYDLIVWLLPYITPGAFGADRLPRRYFSPDALLDHVLGLLSEQGTLLIINQGEDEARVQRELLASRSVEVTELGRLESPWPAFETERYGFRCSVNRAAGVEGAR
tara:strand:+ start:377 stop:1165 length:789 start_codon:yes stop_codon:yes gene_type:complete